MRSGLSELRDLLARTAPVHGPALFLAGGVWDWYTLQLERWTDNLLLLAYLLLYAGATATSLRHADGHELPPWLEGLRRRLDLGAQFALGGLLSAYFVHYLRGAPLQRELGWLILLAGLAVANEVADRRSRGPSLRAALLAFAAFNYFLAVGPLMTGRLMGPSVPLIAATALVAATLATATRGVRLGNETLRACVAALVALGFQLFLVASDRVPPLPLTLLTAEVVSAADGDHYELSGPVELLAPVGLFAPRLRWEPGHAIRVRTPIYLPAGMDTTIVHRWLREVDGDWVTSDRIPLAIRGGREGGYRTWSMKRRATPGAWQVRVETEDGRELGRVTFHLVASEVPATL